MAFSSLNLLLQTQALLSSINYLTSIIPSAGQKMGDIKEINISTEKQRKNAVLQKGLKNRVFFGCFFSFVCFLLLVRAFRILELSGQS